MPCINCYISWAQAWGPTILLPVFIWILTRLGLVKRAAATTGALVPPVYGPAYLPPFIRGILAAVRLGKDEDGFLISLRRDYGPVVYLPWPLGQYFVTSSSAIQRVYDTPSKTLSFVPIRKRLQGSVFGSPRAVWTSEAMEKDIFPTHARALQKSKLEDPLRVFVESIRDATASLAASVDAAGGALEMDLAEWTMATLFEGATGAMFGPSFLGATSKEDFRRTFLKFDLAFPLLASEMVSPNTARFIPPLAKGLAARDELVQIFAAWVEKGMPGVEDGVIKDMADTSARAGWSTYEIAQIIVGDCWAIQANAPFAAVWTLLFTLQSPLLSDVRTEIEALKDDVTSKLDMATLSTSLPLVSSCLHETLRLATSSFSIRIVEEDYFLPVGAPLSPDSDLDAKATEPTASTTGYVIPAGSQVICTTRCEGRHLATAELKAFVVETLAAFEFEFLHPVLADGTAPEGRTPGTTLKISGGRNAIKPSMAEGRERGIIETAVGSPGWRSSLGKPRSRLAQRHAWTGNDVS
ncbi:hypothetical protein RQP46_007792 [Phenoliferia psychrophenolica]